MRRLTIVLPAVLTASLIVSDALALEDTCVAAAAGLRGWWPGDCGAIDLTGRSDGTLVGGAAVLPGRVGNAFYFDGVDDYVSIPHDPAFNPVGPFSVDLWMKAPSGQGGQVLLVDKSHGFADGTGWALQSEVDGRVAFFFGLGGGPTNFLGVDSAESLFDDQWHHVAGVWTGARFEIWVDGVLDGTLDSSVAPANNSRALEIGSAWGGGSRTRYYRGALDEIGYTDHALSAEEIAALFDAGGAGRCSPLPCPEGECLNVDAKCKACGRPASNGGKPAASDALFILKTAVQITQCRLCVCDVDKGGSVIASDALRTLKRAVDQPVELECSVACGANLASTTFPDEFSSGLEPAYWSVIQTTPGLFSVDDTNGDVRMAKTATPSPGGFQNISVRLDMAAIGGPAGGDFSLQIDYRNAVVPGPGVDQIELHAYFEDGSFFFMVYDNSGGTNVHVWNGGLHGATPVATDFGTFAIVRTGTTVTGSHNGSTIHALANSAALTAIDFALQLQPGSNDSASVTFDNFAFSTSE